MDQLLGLSCLGKPASRERGAFSTRRAEAELHGVSLSRRRMIAEQKARFFFVR
jgi:hypothetical protein